VNLARLWVTKVRRFQEPRTADFGKSTAPAIENFVALVMECYASPCPKFALTQALSDTPANDQQQDRNSIVMESPTSDNESGSDSAESYQFDILEDPATIDAIKALYERVHTLKKYLKSSHKIWLLYFLQPIFQAVLAITFFTIDIYFMKDLQETMTCILTQHIPVVHDYFICSHNLAPAFALGLKWFYLPTLWLTLAVLIIAIKWTFSRKREYVFKKRFGIDSVFHDFGFLLHLLHSYNELYLIRFALFLSIENKKEIQAYSLKRDYPVSDLKDQLNENGNKLTFTGIQGISETIFNLATEIVTLEFIENDDFENVCQLSSLRKFSIVRCRLKSIPNGILNIECLEVLNLKGNFIAKVNRNISKLQNLTTLDLSDNNLGTIQPGSFENLGNLLAVYPSGNSKLEMAALKVVLACERLRILDSPRHLSARINELNRLEQNKFDAVTRNSVIPYTPKYAPQSIGLENRERFYKMDSHPKGMAIIFNNYSYSNCSYPNNIFTDRTGSEKDVSILNLLFEAIGFDTICCIDYEAKQVKEFLEECAKTTKYKECDCIAVIIMSHGSNEGLIFPDSKVLPVMDLVKSVQESPFYQGKPKLFFIQTCRGTQHAGGFANLATCSDVTVGNSDDNVASASNQNTVHSIPHRAVADAFLSTAGNGQETTTDALPHVMIQPPSITEGADILLSYSTMDGYVSFRSIGSGSWYVQALVETFCEHAWEEDILSLLTLVNYKVARAYSQSGWRQVPAPQSTLTKKTVLTSRVSTSAQPNRTTTAEYIENNTWVRGNIMFNTRNQSGISKHPCIFLFII
jgi:hypothetical protein